jgi:hypothetical protein
MITLDNAPVTREISQHRDLALDQGEVAALQGADVDDHVQGGAADLEGLVDLGLLGTRGLRAVGERERDADVDVGSVQDLGHQRCPCRSGVVRRDPVVAGALAPRPDHAFGGVLSQDRHVELLGVLADAEHVPLLELPSARRWGSNLIGQP